MHHLEHVPFYSDWPRGFKANLVYVDPPRNKGVNEPILDDIDFQRFTIRWMQLCTGLLANDSRLIIFTDPGTRPVFERLLHAQAPGLVFSEEIIWNFNFGLYTRKRFVISHENILVYKKGRPPFFWQAVAQKSQRQQTGDARADLRGRTPADVWDIPRIPGNSAERDCFTGSDKRSCHPVELSLRLVKAYTTPTDLIFEPFAHDGSLALTTKFLKRNYIGYHDNAQYIEDIRKRLIYPYIKLMKGEL